MTENRFWRQWPADIRIPYLVLLGLALATIAWSIYEYLLGPNQAIPWQTQTIFDSVPVVIDKFLKLEREFQVQASGYLISERYGVGLPEIKPALANLYMGVLALTLVFYLAAVTTLKRLPYAVGMLLFMLLLGSFNADALGIIQSTRNYFLIGALAAYGLLTYYFQAFAPNTGFSTRLLALLVLTAAAGGLVYFRSDFDATTTSLHLIGHSSPAVLIGGFIFCLAVAFEIVLGLLWLNGQGATVAQRPGMLRFVITALLYLLSLVFIFLANTGYLDVDISFLTPFFLLVISFAVGLWGFRFREAVLGTIVPFRVAGAFLYLCFAIFAFLGAAYAFGTANDPIVEAFNDAVVFTHLGLGAMFLIYVLANFGRALLARLPVYRIVFTPPRLPFFTVYTAGGIGVLALVMYTGAVAFYQAQAGYYNYLGDVYLNEGNDLLAERYYTEGHTYENNNVRSNISLAALADKQEFSGLELVFLKRTLRKRPQEKMYVRLANAYANQGSVLEAIFTVREGLQLFPESYRLHNNMALLFAQTDVVDSMAIYIDRATQLSDQPLIRNNALALLLKKGLLEEAREVVAESGEKDYTPYQSNVALLQFTAANQTENAPAPDLRTRVLSNGEFALLYHQLLARLPQTDTSVVNELNELILLDGNVDFVENLNLLKAMVLHYHGSRTAARKTLEQLSLFANGNEGYYYNLLGLWLLNEDLPLAAAAQFEKAKNAGHAPAFLNHAYALGLGGQREEAITEAQRVLTSGNPALITESVNLQRLLNLPSDALFSPTTSDSVKARLLQLYGRQVPAQLQLTTALGLTEPELKARALYSLGRQLVAQNRPVEAETVLKHLAEPEMAAQIGKGKMNELQAGLLLAQNKHQELLEFLDHGFSLGNERLKTYYRASALWQLGRPKEAAVYFKQIPAMLPYHAQALRETARFYSQHLKKPMEAYELLLSAIAYNPFSETLLQAYALQALDLNLRDYASGALEQLAGLLNAEEYATFKATYDQRLAALEARSDNW